MSDELERRLGIIASEVAKAVDTFRFKATQKNRSLLFMHNGIRVEVSEFKLIDKETWSADERHKHYPVVHSSGVGLLWYAASVEWSVGKQKGGGHCAALGSPVERSKVLKGLTPGSSDYSVITDLLVAIEGVASSLFGAELIEKQPPGRERTFAEDRIRIKEREF